MTTSKQQSMTARTTSMRGRTISGPAGRSSLRASAGSSDRLTTDQFRRAKADRAIARIEECYRRGLAIPDVR